MAGTPRRFASEAAAPAPLTSGEAPDIPAILYHIMSYIIIILYHVIFCYIIV